MTQHYLCQVISLFFFFFFHLYLILGSRSCRAYVKALIDIIIYVYPLSLLVHTHMYIHNNFIGTPAVVFGSDRLPACTGCKSNLHDIFHVYSTYIRHRFICRRD